MVLSGATVTTAQMDNTRGSYNAAETVLTPANVGSLLLTGTYVVDGAVYAQPLVTTGCLIVATMNGTIYCEDPATPGVTIWRTHVSDPQTSFVTSSPFFYGKPVGCLSTPVVSLTASRVYAVCANQWKEWTLYSLDLASGAIVGSAIITGHVPGTGCPGTSPADAVSGSNVFFNTAYELQRAPLTLSGSSILVTFSGWDDTPPWHGWAMTYDASTLAQTAIWNATPNGCGGGIWEAAGGTATDGTSYFFATGNGDFDGSANFGMSVVKLSAALAVSDWWTPANYAALNAADADLSSGRVMLVNSYLTFGSKDWYVRLIDPTSMGHLGAPVQQVPVVASPPAPNGGMGIYGGAFGLGTGYFPSKPGPLHALPLSVSSYGSPVASASYGSVQGVTVTSNASTNGLLWIVSTDGDPYPAAVPGTLRALDPVTLAELWHAGIGTAAKFQAPTVVNGRVYLGNADGVVRMFSPTPPTTVQRGVSVTILSWGQH